MHLDVAGAQIKLGFDLGLEWVSLAFGVKPIFDFLPCFSEFALGISAWLTN
jgi:hypothetical protein